MIKILHLTAILLASAPFSSAVVTLQFTQPFSPDGGVAHNFANSAGVATNGLIWGVIIDTDSSGFFTTYDVFTPTIDTRVVLGSGGNPTTNILVTSNVNTASNAFFVEFDSAFMGVNPGGDGGIGSVTSIALTEGVSIGDSFRIVFFDPSGTSAGFVDSDSFIIPSDGSTVDFSAVFRGADPIRPATGITIIPEPSALLLSAFGALALLRRKR